MDTYANMRDELEGLMKKQETMGQEIQKLLSAESGLWRGSPESQSLKPLFRTWVESQSKINQQVGQLITMLDSRIKE